MNCEDVRSLLSSYIDNELLPGETRRVSQHLVRCRACTEEVDTLRHTVSLLAHLGEIELPSGFHDTLHQRIVAEHARRQSAGRTQWLRQMRRWAVPAAAAAAALAIGVSNLPQAGRMVTDATKGSIERPSGPSRDLTNMTPPTPNPGDSAGGKSDPKGPLDNGDMPPNTTGGPNDIPPVGGGGSTTTNPPGDTNPTPGPGYTPPSPPVPRPDSSGGGVATPGGDGTAPPASEQKWTYSQRVTATADAPDKTMAALQARSSGRAPVGNSFTYTVRVANWAAEKAYLQQLLGASTVTAEAKTDLATQIQVAQQLVQDRTTALANFDRQVQQLTDSAEKEMANRQRAQYQQQLDESRDGLKRLNDQVDVVSINVQLQMATR